MKEGRDRDGDVDGSGWPAEPGPRYPSPGKRSGTAGMPGDVPPKWPGKRTLTQHLVGPGRGPGPESASVVRRRRLAHARHLVERAATALGIPAPPVRMDTMARLRSEAWGTHALMSHGMILLHPEHFDPIHDNGAFESIAHELVHVAQLRNESNRVTDGSGELDAESEAREIAEQIASGQQHAKPQVRLTADEAPDTTNKATRSKPSPVPALPAGAPFVVEDPTGTMRISVPWLLEDKAADPSKSRIFAPTKMPALMRELKRTVFWWMTDAAVADSKDVFLTGPIEPGAKVFRAHVTASMFGRIGLPPNLEVVWKIENNKAYEIISTRLLEKIADLPDDMIEMRIPDEVESRSHAALQKLAGRSFPMLVMERREKLRRTAGAIVTEFDERYMRAILKDRWDELVKRPPQDHLANGPFEGLDFAPTISIEDRTYFVAWAKRVYGGNWMRVGTPPDAAIISTLRAIDAHPKKATILAELVKTSPTGTSIDWVRLERLVHDAEEADTRSKYGVATAPGQEGPATTHARPVAPSQNVHGAARARYYERAVTGQVVNLGSLASVGKELELYFATTDPQGIGFVSISVKWIATPIDKPKEHVREGYTSHFAHHKPDKWKVTFDKVGTYRIIAFVDHQSYWPAHFDDTIIEVKTEQERLDEVEHAAFGDLRGNSRRTATKHFFEVSPTNDRVGDDKYTFGDVIEGDVPADFKHRSIEERVKFIGDDRAKLKRLIELYRGEKKNDRDAKPILKYAEHALEALESTKEKIDKDAKDLMPFEIRGSFLSEKNGARSGSLNLIGLAGRRTATIRKGLDVENAFTVRIHDLTQLYEPENAVYTGIGGNLRTALEQAFVDLCKSYPPGRVSVLFEQLNDRDFRPNGKTLGFELHTGTAWKDVKSTVWDGRVQVVVNVLAAAATVFIPGAAIVTIPLITAYNAVDTLDNLDTLHRKGQATWKNDFEAGVMIGLDLLPFLGRLTKAGRLGTKALFALDVAQTTTNVVVLTEQGITQVAALRDQYITEIARLQGEIDELRNVNDSDPRITGKEKEMARLVQEAKLQGVITFMRMAESGAMMLMAPVAFNHLINGLGSRNVKELEVAGMFVHEHGVEPHYDPKIGKIRGDRSLVDPAKVKALQEVYLVGVYREHADVAKLLGVKPEHVVIERKKDQPHTTVAKNDEGIWVITAPDGRPHDKVLDDVWAQRAKAPDAPAERPPRGDDLARSDHDGVAVGAHEPVGKVHGNTLKDSNPAVVLAQAKADLQALAGRMKLKADDLSIEIVVRGKPRQIVIGTAPPTKGNDSPAATYKISDGNDDITITLSDRVAPHHVERALAHELAEISHVLKGGRTGGKNALAPGSNETTLTAHDIGRLAEIDVMERQLKAARSRGDEVTIKRLQDEGLELVKHLGLTGEGGTRRQQLMKAEATRIGDPLVGKALDQLKEIVKTHPSKIKPPPGVKNFVPPLTNPFDRTQVADSIANGHAYDKHVVSQGQFRIDEGHGGKRNMTKEEFSAEIQKVLERGQSKQMRDAPARRIYVLGNTVVIHNPSAVDNGTTWRTPDAVKEYTRS